MAKKSERRVTRAELDHAFRIQRLNHVWRFLMHITMWGALVVIVWLAHDSVGELAGKITQADIKLSATGSFDAEAGGRLALGEGCTRALTAGLLALLFGVASGIYGWRQSVLRRDVVQRFHKYQLMEELRADPGRTSSQLTDRGDTRPEDL